MGADRRAAAVTRVGRLPPLKQALAKKIKWKEYEDYLAKNPRSRLSPELIAKYLAVLEPYVEEAPEAPPEVTGIRVLRIGEGRGGGAKLE